MTPLCLNRSFLFTVVSVFLFNPFLAHAQEGHGAGNGGTVLVCKDTVDEPSFKNKVMLADFAEVAILPTLRGKLTVVESDEEVGVQIERAIRKIRGIDQNLYAELRDLIWSIQNSSKPVGNYYWPVTADVGDFPMPLPDDSCVLKNSINYKSDANIQKNELLISRLANNTHRAGLWVHEGIYRLTRKYANTPNAVPARRLTALLFASETKVSLLKEMVTAYLGIKQAGEHSIFIPESLGGLPIKISVPQCAAELIDNVNVFVDGRGDDHEFTEQTGIITNEFYASTGTSASSVKGNYTSSPVRKGFLMSLDMARLMFYNSVQLSEFLRLCTPKVSIGGRSYEVTYSKHEFFILLEVDSHADQVARFIDGSLD